MLYLNSRIHFFKTERILLILLVALTPLLSFSKTHRHIKSKKPTIPVVAAPFINFFNTSDQQAMVGLSCSSEEECKALCNGTEQCQKPINTCLNCVGSRSPYLNDFFSNMGEQTTTCFEQAGITIASEDLFKSVSMVALTPSSAYNPLSIKDLDLVLKFSNLCPIGTIDPTAIAFTDPITHAILEIPIIKCGKTLYPLVRPIEDCAKKSVSIYRFIQTAIESEQLLNSHFNAAVGLADQLPLTYDILKLSEYSEAHYISCNSQSKAVCESVCHSSLSCSIPLDNLSTANTITEFHKHKWTACAVEQFSPELLVNYLQSPDTVSFSSQSLSQSYDLASNTGGFSDFTVINSMLSDFSNVFVSQNDESDPSGRSFLISNSYREKLEKQLKSLCDETTEPVIFGRGNRIERVFCRSELNGYFRLLTADGKTCNKRGNL